MKTKKMLYIGSKIALLFALLGTTVFGATIVATSTDGRIEFQTGNTHYVNVGQNSSIIGNELQGLYYDQFYGFYTFNNLRFSDSTTKCTTGYGYQLSGTAVSPFAGTLNLSNLYYCVDGNTLHGTAYNNNTGMQSFEGISFILDSGIANGADTSNSIFVNDSTDINQIKKELEESFESNKGSQFYIIK